MRNAFSAFVEYLAEVVEENLLVWVAILIFGTMPLWLGLLANVVHR